MSLTPQKFVHYMPDFMGLLLPKETALHLFSIYEIILCILIATILIGIALSVNRLVFNQNINQPFQLSIGIDVAYIGFIAALVAAVQAFISINA